MSDGDLAILLTTSGNQQKTLISSTALGRASLTATRATFSNANASITWPVSYVAQVGTLSAVRTLELPAANTYPAGFQIIISDESGTASETNYINIVRGGSDTINGITSVQISIPNSSRIFISNGSNRWLATSMLKATQTGEDLDMLSSLGATIFPKAGQIWDGAIDAQIFTGSDGEAAFNNFAILNLLGETKSAFQNALHEVVEANTPTSGGTVSIGSSKQNTTVYLTPAGTLATLTLTLPAEVNSRDGQIVRVFTTQQLTSLTVNVSGSGTIQGTTLSTLSANTGAAFQRVSSSSNGTWIRLY